MAEDFAAVATASSLIETADVRHDLSRHTLPTTFADRAETGIQLASRWAGIVAFVGAVAAIAWLIF